MVDFSFLLFEFSVWLNAILHSRCLSPYALSFFLPPSLVLFIIVISAIVLTMNYPVSVHLCVWTDRAGFPLEWILSFIYTVYYKEIQKQDTSLWNFEPDSGLGKIRDSMSIAATYRQFDKSGRSVRQTGGRRLHKYLLRGFPGLFTVISEHICFLLLVFFLFLHFLVVGSVR